MLSSCGARLLFGQDKLNQEPRQVPGDKSSNSSNSHRANRRDYCVTAASAAAATSEHSSDHLEFTFSSGGQSLLAARDESSGTSTRASSGGDKINRVGQHEFALVSSDEYHQLGLNPPARFAHDRGRASESERHGGGAGCRRQLDDSLPQPPTVAHGGDARKLAAPLPPTPPVHAQQQQQQQQHRKLQHHHQSIHQKLQQIYGSRLQEIELRQQGQEKQQQHQQRTGMINQQQRLRGVCNGGTSMANGHKAECLAHLSNHTHSRHLEQTYDSLVSIDPLRPPAPPEHSLKCSAETNRGDFYDVRAQDQRAAPVAATSGFRAMSQRQEGDDEEEEEEEELEEEQGAVELNQFWPYGKSERGETRERARVAGSKLRAAHRAGVVGETEHKRHLASIHYATSTAAALLNAAASATAAIATAESASDRDRIGDAHRARIDLHPVQRGHTRQQVEHTPYAVHRPPPPERPYQQLYSIYHNYRHQAAGRPANQPQHQQPTQPQATFLQWHRNKKQQRPVYQVYAPVPLYGHQGVPSERVPPVAAAAAVLAHQLKLQLQQGRQVSTSAPKTNSDAMARPMVMIQNERKRAGMGRLGQAGAVGAQDARLLLSAARLNQANRVYENAVAGEMAHYQLMLAACKPARHQRDNAKRQAAQIYAAAARQHSRMPAPRAQPPSLPLLPVIYNRLAPLARYANDDEGARALLSGSSSSGESACHLGPASYASVPLIVRRNGACGGPAGARNEASLLGRLRRVDLTLFWWLLLIVCLISLSLAAALSRVLAT